MTITNEGPGRCTAAGEPQYTVGFARCVESPNPAPGTSVVLQATSRPVGPPRMDIGPAREVVGYVPRDTWPEGLPFPVE